MKRFKTISKGALALALGIGMVATPLVVSAEEVTYPQPQFQQVKGNGFGKYFAGSMHTTVASNLGITDDELYTLRYSGKSIAQIANEKGVATESLTSTLVLAKIERIEQLFNDGTITESQKDYMLSQVEDRTITNINRTEIGNQGQGRKGMRYNQDPTLQQQQTNMQQGFGKRGSAGMGFNTNNQ